MRRGFTILEVIMTLGLLVMFFAASGEVFRSTVLLSSAGENLSNQSSQIDSAVWQLRKDVWNSRSISVPATNSVELSIDDKTSILWKIDSAGDLVRATPSGNPQRWPAIGTGWTFSTDAVSISISDGSSAPIRMISQVLLSRKEEP
jgi:hypothetical protein